MPSIEEVRSKLSREFLDRYNIHSVGLRRPSNAIVVRVEGAIDPALREDLRQQVKPYELIVVSSSVAHLF